MREDGGTGDEDGVHLMLCYAILAATCDAISDTISDEVVGDVEAGDADSSDDEITIDQSPSRVKSKSSTRFNSIETNMAQQGLMTGEQDFIVSTTLSLIVSLFLFLANPADNFVPSIYMAGTQLAIFGGLCHAFASIYCMKAWERLPSGVMVPMLQLESPIVEVGGYIVGKFADLHWILEPFRASIVSKSQVGGFLLILTGSMLPTMMTGDLFRNKKMLLNKDVVLALWADLGFSLETMMMFSACSLPMQSITSTQFVIVSNVASFGWTFLGILIMPSMSKAFSDLRQVATRSMVLCSFSEFANYFAMLSFSIALQKYHDEGLTLAIRQSCHQLVSFVLANFLFHTFRFGRRPKGWKSKVFSLLLVTTGFFFAIDY